MKAPTKSELIDSLDLMTIWVEAWLQPKNIEFWSPDQYDVAKLCADNAREILKRAGKK